MHYCKLLSRFYGKNIRDCRQASNFQKPRLSPMPQRQMRLIKDEFLKNCNNMNAEKWHEVRENIIKNFKQINRDNIDATILGMCNEAEHFNLAKNYVSYLNENGIKPNLATLGRLLRVYHSIYQHNGEKITKVQEDEVLQICNKIQGNHEVLDSITCEHLIHGLVATESEWKKALDLLQMLKLTASPGTSVYEQLIRKAFLCKEFEIGWNLLEEMVQQGKPPKCEIYMTLIDVISHDSEIFRVNFRKLLKFLEKFELLLSEKVAAHMEALAKNSKLSLNLRIAKIDRFGKCLNCQEIMESVSIEDEDYERLRDSFLQKVLVRNDVFQKSSPEEIELFKRFVEETAPYDCVIDGLNVAFSKGSKRSPKELADLLGSVVRYFKNKNKSVLVLGREHMNKWPKSPMEYLRKHAHIYLTKNLTHDDPFLLYATLKSGKSTDFFSRDLMRSHAHLLGSDLKAIFRRWQQMHQFSLITKTTSGKVIIKEPTRYLLSAHKVNNTWHLPLIPEYISHMPETFELPYSWLCVRFEKTM